MANNRYNKQVTPKGYMKGGRVEKMGGGMMKRTMLKKGSKFPDLNKDGKVTKADILMGRGVIGKKKKKPMKKNKNKKVI
jgi:hypothetical protein|tara:strand:+ start:228 stop:464 length:237 start_codon:yes stop_codon:yes gene_type:complete